MSAPSLKEIADALAGEVSGMRACFPTPGHSAKDRGSWASIVPHAPDGVLIHCSNGGDPIVIKNMLRDAGVLPPLGARHDKVPWKAPARATGVPKDHGVYLKSGQRIVATFNYVDGAGVVLYRKHRVEPGGNGRPKSFAYDHADGQGGWKSGAGDRRVPYRLPDLLTAPKNMPVYMTEGEAKADKVASWGLLATSYKDWSEHDFAAFIRERRIYVLPDHDEAGRAQRDSVCSKLKRTGCETIVIDLPGLPDGGDILDWDGTVDDLQTLVRQFADQTAITTLDFTELAKQEPKPKEFAIAPLAPAGEVTLCTGKGSAGKSLLAQQLATAAAIGNTALGCFTPSPMTAAYITCEDDAQELHWRQKHICDAMGIALETLAGKLHLASLRGQLGNELAVFAHDGTLKPTTTYERLRSLLRETGAAIVFLDNIAHLFAGNENDRYQVAAFINLLNRLAGETNIAIVLLGHPNKAGDNYSGSTAWINQVRSHFFIEHDVETDMRTLTITKANYARTGDQVRFFWRNWSFVSEAEMRPDEVREMKQVQRAAGDSRIFLECLRQITREGRNVSEKACHIYAPVVFSKMPEAKGLGKERLERAMSLLFREGKIERAVLGKGLDRKPKIGLRETGVGG